MPVLVILALAACIKATQLLFLPWFIVQRRWKATLAFSAGLVLWGALVPVAVLGGSEYAKACTTWYEGLVAPMTAVDHVEGGEARGGYLPGQSLRAMSHRLLRPIDASAHDDEGAGEHEASLGEAGEVDEVHVEGAPRRIGVGEEADCEGEQADRDGGSAGAHETPRQIPRIRSFRRELHGCTPFCLVRNRM